MNNNSSLKRIISLMLAVALVFQLNGITVLATERVIDYTINQNVNLIEENNKGDNTQKENNNAQITTQSEEEGVELLSVGIEKNEIHNWGEETKVYVNVTKHNEINYIEVFYGGRGIKLDYNSESGRFEGVVKDDKNFSLDTITELESIYIETYAGDIYIINREQALNDYGIDFSMADFKVIQWQPQINSIEMESKIIEFPNGESKIAIDVEEADTVQYIALEYSNEYDNSYLELYFNEDTGKFETTIYAKNYSYEEGYNTKKFEKIYFYSKNWSLLVLNRDELTEHILEDGQNEDILDFRIEVCPTTIKSITLENKTINYNGLGKVYIEVDKPEEIISIDLIYDNPDYYHYNYVNLNYNESTGRFEGDINPRNNYDYDENMNDFTLNTIVIYKNDYWEYIYRDEINSKYGLSEDVADFKVTKRIPKVTSIELENNVITYPNGNTNIYMDVTEKDIINSITLDYYSEIYGYYNNVYLYYNSEIGKYEGTISISNYTDDKFTLNSINIYYNGGYETYTRSDLNNKFGINVEDADYKQEKERVNIKSFISENNTIYPNVYRASSIKLKMEVENPQDIYSITVKYGSRYNDYSDFYVYMGYNYETGLFEGETSPDYYMLGENEVKEVYIYKYYGTITLSKEDLKKYENIDLDSLTVNIIPYVPNDIFVNISEAKKGDTVKISADLSNYPFDIENVRINYNFRPISGGSWSSELQFQMKYNEETRLYEAEYKISGLTSGGMKEVYSLEITDTDYGVSTIYHDGYTANLGRASFEVVNDINKFIYSLKVKAETNKAELSDKVKVSISGINLTNGSVQAKYINLNTYEEKYIYLNYNKKSKSWEGYFNVDTYLSDGIWVLDSISLGESLNFSWTSIDVYNREIYKNKEYTKDFSKADIEVTGTISDTKAPELIAVNVNKKQAQVGDNVIVTIDAKDDLSGIKAINLTYYNGSSYMSINEAKLNPITGKYEAYIKINGVNLNGTYKLSNILLIDNANNQISITNNNMFSRYTDIYEDLSAANFEVVNNIDSVSEIITSLTVNNKEAQINEEVQVSMTLANRTGVDKIVLSYSNEYKYKEVILTYDEESNKYKGILKLDSSTKLGQWQIQNVYFINSSNRYIAYIGRDDYNYNVDHILDEGTFEVVIKSDESLKLNSLSIDKNRVTKDEKVTIQAKASDVNGEIRKIIVEYISPDGKTLNINLKETSNGFIGEFLIEQYTSPGKWMVNSILLEDNERNRSIIYNTEINHNKVDVDLSKADIEVYGTTLDNEAPILLDAEFEKELYEYGDKVKLSITAKDDISGIKSVKATFSISGKGGPDEFLEFTYNEGNNKYEYIIDTTQPNIYNDNWINNYDSWGISLIEIEDNVGNVYRSSGYENEILRSAYFYVYPTGKWFVEELTDKSEEVSGVTEPNANIVVTVENEIYRGQSDEFGKFKIEIPSQEGNTVVKVKVINSLGVTIQDVEKIVQDIHAPEIPLVTTVVNNKTTVLEGVAEANSIVVIEKEVKVFGGVKIEEIARVVADSEGNFKVSIPMQSVNTYLGVKAIDKVGNVSEYTNIIVKNINREDVNYDDVIDILDLALVAREYNTLDGDNLWDTNLDVNEDGIIDIFDIITVSKKME